MNTLDICLSALGLGFHFFCSILGFWDFFVRFHFCCWGVQSLDSFESQPLFKINFRLLPANSWILYFLYPALRVPSKPNKMCNILPTVSEYFSDLKKRHEMCKWKHAWRISKSLPLSHIIKDLHLHQSVLHQLLRRQQHSHKNPAAPSKLSLASGEISSEKQN